MTTQLQDRTGAPVTISVTETQPVGSFIVHVADGTDAGRVDFIGAPDTESDRIFFHREVAPEFNGRGLGGLLVREALADSIRHGMTVVPVCPLFADHLQRHGAEFLTAGGRFRQPTRADDALVRRAFQGDAES